MHRLLLTLLFLLLPLLLIAQPEPWIPTTITDNTGHSTSMATGDIDGDGDPDIVVGNGNSSIRWFENPWPGEEWTVHSFGDYPFTEHSTCVGDFDGDGDIDVAGSTSSGLLVYWNDATTFHPEFLHLQESDEATVGDMNGDGLPDLINLEEQSELAMYTWNEGWTRIQIAQFTDGSYWQMPLDPVDWDGDGLIDLLFAKGGGDNSGHNVALQDAGGSFGLHHITGLNAEVTRGGDIDRDGDMDLAVVAGNIWWYEDEGVDFSPHGLSNSSGMHEDLLLLDVDMNGLLDVIVCNLDNLHLFRQTSWRTFEATGFPDMFGAAAIATADFNMDGFIDLANLQDFAYELTWWENPGVEPNAMIDLVPLLEPPYVVTPGQPFPFTVTISHFLLNPASGVVWSEAELPNGTVIGPLATLPVTFQGVDFHIYEDLQQMVPAMTPPGMYQFRVNIGLTTQQPLDSDYLNVIVPEPAPR